jgi:pyridoxine kinase
MGDDGHMYVPKSLLPIYRDTIIPLADVITPNQYEMELLTGKQLKTADDIWSAIDWCHEKGVKTVAISSTDLSANPNDLLAFLSHKKGDVTERFTLTVPKQGGKIRFTGTGDLFAALFLAHSHMSKQNMGEALEKATATLQSVITNTLKAIPSEVRDGKVAVTSQQRELKIIQSKVYIETPVVSLRAVKM